MEIHRVCEVTATPIEEGANLSGHPTADVSTVGYAAYDAGGYGKCVRTIRGETAIREYCVHPKRVDIFV